MADGAVLLHVDLPRRPQLMPRLVVRADVPARRLAPGIVLFDVRKPAEQAEDEQHRRHRAHRPPKPDEAHPVQISIFGAQWPVTVSSRRGRNASEREAGMLDYADCSLHLRLWRRISRPTMAPAAKPVSRADTGMARNSPMSSHAARKKMAGTSTRST